MSEMKIRNATPADVEQIHLIECECFPAAEAASKKSIIERVDAFPGGFLVGEIGGKIVGFINGAVTDGDHIKDEFFASMSYHQPNGSTLMVFGLDVLPNHQRKGYAAELMNAFIQKGREDGRVKVILTCKEHLVHYYEKFGFVNEGVSDSEHGGAKWYDMYLNL